MPAAAAKKIAPEPVPPVLPAKPADKMVEVRAKRMGRHTVNPNETREQKLVRLATARVNKAVKMIGYLGNLATYKPTDSQIDKIMEALGAACSHVEGRLRGTRKVEIAFTIN